MSAGGDGEDDLVQAVYGDTRTEESEIVDQLAKKANFFAWHHPVKQVVRSYQWEDLTRRLIKDHFGEGATVLRYFTLPGPDLLDVRLLADALNDQNIKIEYFGFDVSERSPNALAPYHATESALRQSGCITDDAEVLPDLLEDIAQPGSQAENRLKQQRPFDIVNVDTCDHISFVPEGRQHSLFDAMMRLMTHQLKADRPWLFFITTRADPNLLGDPGASMQGAIHENLKHNGDDFAEALAECLGGETKTVTTCLSQAWAQPGTAFLKALAVGLGKYLLQFFHAQPNLRASVELVSAFSYRVHTNEPDMLSLAFRISPSGLKVLAPTAGIVVDPVALEAKHGIKVAKKAGALWDVDGGISNADVRKDAITGTVKLLQAANYDLDAWRVWLSKLQLRPMQIGEDFR